MLESPIVGHIHGEDDLFFHKRVEIKTMTSSFLPFHAVKSKSNISASGMIFRGPPSQVVNVERLEPHLRSGFLVDVRV